MSTISNSLTGSSLVAYLQSATAKARAQEGQTDATAATTKQADGTKASTASTASASTTAATKAAVVAASRSYQSSSMQGALDKKQSALGADLRAALAKSGVELSGAVSFQVSSAGKLVVGGSDADKAKVEKFLKADTSSPSFTTRVTSLTDAAETLSKTIKQTASISQAARYASGPSGLLSLYATLSKQQDSTAASFTLSGTDSSLSYAGVLTSRA